MAISAAAIAKAAAVVLTNEKTRKALGWTIVAILSPLILIVVIILGLLSGTTQHNNAAVDLTFNGGAFPASMDAAYVAHIQDVQASLVTLDYSIADVNAMMESGSLDGAMVKAVFYSLCFGEDKRLSSSEARTFADCFVRYETRTETVVIGTDAETGQPITQTVSYTVAVPVSQYEAYNNLAAAGYAVTSELSANAHEVYIRIGYGNDGSYSGSFERGNGDGVPLSELVLADPLTKNADDLVRYAENAWRSGWGYVWGTYGNVLTESLLQSKIAQYPEGVGNKESIIREKWLGGRTTDCVGLIKGYGWLDPETNVIGYADNGMPDIGADQMYNSAAVKGSMATMPDTPGLAVWHSGHIGVYIGNGEVIEAMGTSYGVVKTKLDERNWSAWLEIPYIAYN